MQFRMDASFSLKQKEVLKKELGINAGGRVQTVIDTSVIHYLRLAMPASDNKVMIDQTKNPMPGYILVDVPYAHYQNEGELYVMPQNGKGAFHDPVSGMFWSIKDERKIPSGRPMDYSKYAGTERGPHFVERTLEGHFNDILNEAKKEVGK